MILFVCDQIAGAEYIFPLLLDFKKNQFTNWTVVSSEVSSRFLANRGFDSLTLKDPSSFDAESYLDRLQPELALISTSQNSLLERKFLQSLKKRGTHSYQFIDNWMNYSQRFTVHNELLYPDGIFTLDTTAKEEMIRAGIPEQLIQIVGQPYLEYQLNTLSRSKEPHTNKNSVLLISQPVAQYYNKRLDYDEVSFVKTALQSCQTAGISEAKIKILLHPTQEPSVLQKLLPQERSDQMILKKFPDHLDKFGHVLGMFSLLMVQTSLVGIPTASLQPGGKGEDLCFLSKKGYIPKLTTVEETVTFLQTDQNFNPPQALIDSIRGSLIRLKTLVLEKRSTK